MVMIRKSRRLAKNAVIAVCRASISGARGRFRRQTLPCANGSSSGGPNGFRIHVRVTRPLLATVMLPAGPRPAWPTRTRCRSEGGVGAGSRRPPPSTRSCLERPLLAEEVARRVGLEALDLLVHGGE